MAKYISLFSEALHKTYVTNSKLSTAYLFYIAFWLAVIAPPVVLVLTLPAERKTLINFAQPNLKLTGKYFVAYNGIEATFINPSSAIELSHDAVDINGDSITDVFELTLISTFSNETSSLYTAVEALEDDGTFGVLRLNSPISPKCNRLTSDFTIEYSHSARDSGTSADLVSILNTPGQKRLFKLLSAYSPFSVKAKDFATVCQPLMNSQTLTANIRIHIPHVTKPVRPSYGDIVRQNIVYLVIYLIVNYHILNFVVKIIIKSGLLKMKVLVQYELSPKHL